MDPERFERLDQLFRELCDASDERRRDELARLRGDSPELAAQLERMLGSDARSGASRLERVQDAMGHVAATTLIESGPAPKEIAGFRILDVLGSGGMGTVYRAEQSHPRRHVALKILHPVGADETTVRRFELEAQALGRLQHPGIAQVFEAGSAPVGGRLMPYLAMELVEGEPLTRFARARDLGRRERIALLIKVADAVHHAHQKGIVHRDLKPANLLVTPAGEPKVLDFGVARIIDPDFAAATLSTQVGQVLGTLPYMSPEQISGAVDSIDTRSDVYALGAIAYELLAGRLPHDLTGKPVPEAARIVTERDAALLGSLDPALRGDVETIVAKALEREPERRYASARELAADLQRHLNDEPIEARPASTAYQLRKFTRRHRGLVAGLGTAVVVLIGAVIGLTALTIEAREERRVATAVNRVLDRILTAPDPWATAGASSDARVVDALEQAEAGLDAALRDDPPVEAAVRATLGRTWLNLGAFDRARPHLVRAIELFTRLRGGDARETLECKSRLASTLADVGELDEGLRLARESADGLRRLAGAVDAATVDADAVLVHVLRDRGLQEQALDLARSSFEATRAALGDSDPTTLRAHHNLAAMLLALGQLEEAERHMREVADRRRDVLGPENPSTLASRSAVAEVLWRQGRSREAEPISRELFETHRRLLGADHPTTLRNENGLACQLEALGRNDESLTLREEARAAARSALGDDVPLTLELDYGLAALLHKMRRFADSELLCRELVATHRRVHREGLLNPLNLLGTLLVDQGRPAEALAFFEETVDLAAATRPEKHWTTARYRANYGNALRLVRRFEEAEEELADSLETLKEVLGVDHADVQYVLAKLVLLYEDMGEAGRAKELRQELGPIGRMHAQR